MKLLITGGAGFIGSALIRYIMANTDDSVVNVDKLTYASHLNSLKNGCYKQRYTFEKVDICCSSEINRIFSTYQPDAVIHLAAESHVDRSIIGPMDFIQTNIVGTYILLEAARSYWQTLPTVQRQAFRFHHVSTDEVYGDLDKLSAAFTETTPYAPSSPYSASKASSDHLVRSWYRTYQLPTLITNCSNNYGPHQFPEKLIPLMILNAMAGKQLPIYGDGQQIRDWLYVEDHVRALYLVLTRGIIGETYNIGGGSEKTNLEVVHLVCELLEELMPIKPLGVTHYLDLITYVDDRPGHDVRYAINTSKINAKLGWFPNESFATGMRKTVQWYMAQYQTSHTVEKGVMI